MSSLSQVLVKKIENLQPHPNADLLLIGESDGMPFIVNKNDTNNGSLRCIVPFDIICPSDEWVPEFIRGQRVRPVRLRGIFSMAVCLPLPEGEFAEGEDVTERLGFTKWEPAEVEENSSSGYSCKGPGINLSKYDLDSLRKYHNYLKIGEEVLITAKLHGENISVVWWDDQFHIRSRTRWIKDGDNKWWNTFRQYDFSFLKNYPGYCLIGEKYGNINKFRYDCIDGQQRIRIFDVYNSINMKFLPLEEFIKFTSDNNVETVPTIYKGPWKGIDYYKNLTEGPAILGGYTEEGYVVEPFDQRFDYKVGRIKFKWHSERFLIHSGKS